MTATRSPEADDRYSAPIEASRRGAHRARPKPASAGLPVAAGLAVVVLVLGGGYAVLSGNETDDGNVAAAVTPSADAPTSTAPASAPPTTAVAVPRSAPASTPVEEPPSSAPVAPDPGPDVNRGINLRVLNSTGTKGLAARVQQKVEGAGWSVKGTGNSRNRNLPVTKIYYGRTSTRATAQALRDDLGYGTAVLDRTALQASGVTTSGLVVVLGADAG